MAVILLAVLGTNVDIVIFSTSDGLDPIVCFILVDITTSSSGQCVFLRYIVLNM